ncbi:MarR family winged helix-turn-helix transcriptional regulator [Kangiella taiwanensis]|uniref:MarR family winged helix-turn-helix transcriptional regulator n=1 Tax=Kangiella taiwanensis TaxID=1079179 RepID=UPI001CBE3A61|nr:MarR family transcriptional regulator [Kangiella taiwanensis]
MNFQQDSSQKLFHLLNSFHQKSKSLEKASGLTQERLDILNLLVTIGPKTINQLAEEEGVSAPAITRTIKGLEKLGYVIKSRSKTDQRVVFVAPTRKSQQVIESLRLQQQKYIDELLRGVSEDDLGLLSEQIGKII